MCVCVCAFRVTRNTKLVCWYKALATLIRCFCPPDRMIPCIREQENAGGTFNYSVTESKEQWTSLHPQMPVALVPRVAGEITVYFLHYCCLKKSNMTVLCPHKVIAAPHTQTPTPRCTVAFLQYSEPQWELWPCLENQTAEKF